MFTFDLFSSQMDPWLAAIVVGTIFFSIIAVWLYRGKRLAEKSRRRTSAGRYFSPQPDFVPPRPILPPPVTRMTAAEIEVSNLINQFANRGFNCPPEQVDRLSRQVLSRARQVISGDHWLLALALNCRAVYLINSGFYSDASRLLEPAVAIISEWPGEGDKDKNIALLKANLKICRDHLGF